MLWAVFEEARVVNQHDDTFAFGFRAVQDRAPKASGVYTIYTSRRWLFVGESDDIQNSLYGHLNDPSPCLSQRGSLSFSFELVAPAQRLLRQHALMKALVPLCNAASHSRGAGVLSGP